MQCEYCDCQVIPYPASGICPHCGARLAPEPPPAPAAPIYRVPVTQPGIHCCPRCMSTAIRFQKRGFGWAAGLVGFFFLPPFGLLFGLIGRNNLKYTCCACSHKWIRK